MRPDFNYATQTI
ncbi:Protein of unknown function [Leuconostoc citreum]|nr:Protein of unknown function [Leuconostoc citreum LBAE C10]CDX64472.1 Protein of unknown function [Leuconostoc citreum]CDX66182.1 Protein of unknown function [Leuconostoc citreum]